MNEQARQFMAAAIRHQTVALFLQQSVASQPATREWAIIAAFYAAVHYINAYLMERLGIEPSDHAERSELVARVTELREILEEYHRLRTAAYAARYRASWRATDTRVHTSMDDLEAIAAVVVTALNRP